MQVLGSSIQRMLCILIKASTACMYAGMLKRVCMQSAVDDIDIYDHAVRISYQCMCGSRMHAVLSIRG